MTSDIPLQILGGISAREFLRDYWQKKPLLIRQPKAPHAPKAAMAIELWAEKRAQLENGKIDADEYEDWKASL